MSELTPDNQEASFYSNSNNQQIVTLNEKSNRNNSKYQEKHQKRISKLEVKSQFKNIVILVIVFFVGFIILKVNQNQTDFQTLNQSFTKQKTKKNKYYNQNIDIFLTRGQQETINNLIKPHILDPLSIKFNHKNPETRKQQLNRILSMAGEFILLARTQNNNIRYVFGVYGNQNQPKQSFIFSLNKKSKHFLTKAAYLIQIDRQNLKGPSFGKLDISLFNSKNHNNCKTNFCYSFQCPLEIEYNTQQAKTYLAGKQQFHIDEIVVFVIDK